LIEAVTSCSGRAYSRLSERAGPWVGFGVRLSDWGVRRNDIQGG